ncbi:PKD domain-containing protein [bacterium]|nr:PKD domain-containing protein [bacterium]
MNANRIKKILFHPAVFPALLLALAACSSELFRINEKPVIESLNAEVYEVHPGDTVRVWAAVKDGDDDVLTYAWSAGAGTFIPPANGSEVYWKAPAGGGSFLVTLTVSDESESVSSSIQVVVLSMQKPYVRILHPMPGKFYVLHDTAHVKAIATHENGIREVRLFLRDVEAGVPAARSGDHYSFVCALEGDAGPSELKVTAFSNNILQQASDSVSVCVEGILIGKKGAP